MQLLIEIYLVGFILSLTFFKYFGVKIGFNYDDEKTYADYDDWDSNAQAFTAFSLFWPIIMPLLLIMGIIKIIFKFSKWYLNNQNK